MYLLVSRSGALFFFNVLLFLLLSPSSAKLQRSSTLPKALHHGLEARQDPGLDNCGLLFAAVSDYTLFFALDVYNCLITTPFNQTVATQFIKYYNDTLQFQSTLAYLKDPPASYQQPAVDLLGGLDILQSRVNSGAFDNEYDFEVALQRLVYAAHDSHLYLYGGVTDVFSFGMQDPIVSVSIDGVALPKVYMQSDLDLVQQSNGQWTPSAIAAINGQEVTDFLTEFAANNSLGYSNPDADWNNLMYSPAQDIQYINNALDGSSPFYPGDVFSVIFENGSTIASTKWVAVYNDPAAVYNNVGVTADSDDADCSTSIRSKEDFYNCYVVNDGFGQDVSQLRKRDVKTQALEKFSARFLEHKRQATTDPQNHWNNTAYPSNPIVAEQDLGVEGVLSGYFLSSSSTAVLSIPNFFPGNTTGFSDTVSKFLQLSKANGMQKIVVDLQQNHGGIPLLATDVFKQFFPTIEPFAGSRERAQPLADALGDTYTNAYNSYEQGSNNSLADNLTYNIWPASIYIDAVTNQNFTSWAQYFGPNADRGDLFTTTQRDNLSSIILDEENIGEAVYGYGNRSNTTARPPYAAEDMVILTDSLCASTCTLFVEMMHQEAGVKIVTVGGRPQPGPIQAMGGTRGALAYDADSLDYDIYVAEEYLNGTLNQTLPDRDVSFRFDEANFNLRDQIRNGSNFPLQFSQESADCRIFYTMSTYNDYAALWQYTADAIWKNSSLCVSLLKNSSESANFNNDENERALESRKLGDDSGGRVPGTLCDPSLANACGDLICVLSPSCKGNTFLPNTHQCQIACDGRSRGCARGQNCIPASTNACPFPGAAGTNCNYCAARQVTKQTCRASSTKGQVPHGLYN